MNWFSIKGKAAFAKWAHFDTAARQAMNLRYSRLPVCVTAAVFARNLGLPRLASVKDARSAEENRRKGRKMATKRQQETTKESLKGDRETTPIRSGPSAVADRQVLREGSLSFSKRISILTDRFVSLLMPDLSRSRRLSVLRYGLPVNPVVRPNVIEYSTGYANGQWWKCGPIRFQGRVRIVLTA